MREQLSVANELQKFFEQRGWKFAVIGGIANLAWGEIRTTRDVDITLFTPSSEEEPILDGLLEKFQPRIQNARNFAKANRVLLLKSNDGIGIDIAFASFDIEKTAIDRSMMVDYGSGISLRVITAEDLIVMKAFAGREQDWADIAGIARRQDGILDWNYIEQNLLTLSEIADDPSFLGRTLAYREHVG